MHSHARTSRTSGTRRSARREATPRLLGRGRPLAARGDKAGARARAWWVSSTRRGARSSAARSLSRLPYSRHLQRVRRVDRAEAADDARQHDRKRRAEGVPAERGRGGRRRRRKRWGARGRAAWVSDARRAPCAAGRSGTSPGPPWPTHHSSGWKTRCLWCSSWPCASPWPWSAALAPAAAAKALRVGGRAGGRARGGGREWRGRWSGDAEPGAEGKGGWQRPRRRKASAEKQRPRRRRRRQRRRRRRRQRAARTRAAPAPRRARGGAGARRPEGGTARSAAQRPGGPVPAARPAFATNTHRCCSAGDDATVATRRAAERTRDAILGGLWTLMIC